MPEIQIIAVGAGEIDILQPLSVQTFSETFAPDNTEENLKHYLETGFNHKKLLAEMNHPDSQFYFAKQDNKVIGYLKVNFAAAQTDVHDPESLEIERIYVLKEFHGINAGQALFAQALEIAKENQMRYTWLGVWEKNTRAIRFYEKNGFTAFSSHVFTVGDDDQTDILMKLIINP